MSPFFQKTFFFLAVRQLRRASVPRRCHPIDSSNADVRLSRDWVVQYFFCFVQQTVPSSDLSTQYRISFHRPVRGGIHSWKSPSKYHQEHTVVFSKCVHPLPIGIILFSCTAYLFSLSRFIYLIRPR